jgi:hypothetical protein
MNAAPAVRIALLVGFTVATQAVGCKVTVPGGIALPQGTAAPAAPAGTSLPPANGTTEVATPPRPGAGRPAETVVPVTATATTTATLPAPLPSGTPVSARVWHTVVKAPGLPDMTPAGDLGPNTRFVVVTGNDGLNTLRADLGQPSNAWVTGVPTGTLLVAAFLGLRRGDGHDIEIVSLAVDGDTVNVAVRAVAPGEWLGGGPVFPVHLVALERAALPAGPLTFRFVDADALGSPGRMPAFDVALEPVDPGVDTVVQKDVLILQTANQGTATP